MISPNPQPEDPAAAAPEEAYTVLRETFGFDAFREGQEEVVAAVLEGRDVLCVMPTGAGKSLCYQLPAVLREGVTLVVSPLISLMQDQVESLRRHGVPAAEIHSMVPLEEQDQALDDAARGDLKLLFVAPERFRNARFRRRILGAGVSLVAIDEAHCISQWGHDFRPDYRRLGAALEALESPQVLALTATAPPEVQDDVVEQLNLREPARFVRGIVRANLAYEVVRARGREAKDAVLRGLLADGGATLVYCATRKEVDRVHGWLRAEKHPALRYHAGLDDGERARSQEAFLSGEAQLMVATNAFGMGVDRPDIRCVVHYDIPRSVEAYVQETGRAGRDGEPARCVLLFNPADLHIQRFFLESANPSREVVTEVFRVLRSMGEGRLELTADDIAARMHVQATGRAVGSALAVLDRASLVRRGGRKENLAQVTVLPSAGDLFTEQPLPPGLGRLFAHLIERFGVNRASGLDVVALAEARGVTPETIRRGLTRLHDLARIEYVPPFRGRATELKGGLAEDALAHVDFELLEAKRRREEDRLDEMVGFTASPGCRVRYLLACFGVADGASCGVCDRCAGHAHAAAAEPPDERTRETVRVVLEAVRAYDKRYGFRKLAGHLAGSRAEGIASGPLSRGDTYGRLSHLGVKGAERWLRTAYDAGLLRLVPHKLAGGGRTVHLVALAPSGRGVLKGDPLPALP
ncbi:MAG: RecQ family ATP-dependent DNA helicase [Planctomycetota bacterium]|nr:RecQ family ATP-dependent DNA helicase [Planctomycetota bacterium]